MEEKRKIDLELENEELRERLREAEEVVGAIRRGEVDALAVSDSEGERIYTLKSADRVYRILMDSMNEGALTLSRDGTILYGNLRLEQMLGVPLSRVVGASILQFIPLDEQKDFEALIDRARQGSTRGEMQLLGGSDASLAVSLSISLLELDGSSGFCIVVSDLTEQKRVEKELTRSRKELEDLVEDRTKELIRARDAMEERVNERTAELKAYAARLESINRELRDFVFVATHDLQEPLRKIQTFCSRIEAHRYFALLDEPVRADFDRIKKSAKKMQGLIHALSSYSVVISTPKALESVDLNQIIGTVISELGGLMKETGAKVRSFDLPSIEANSDQMHRLFKNLIENALKFRGKEPPLIKIYGEILKGTLRVFVEDNGIGLDEQYLDRIFKPFQQLHARDRSEGTGIGLAICRKIVELHRGTITAASSPGVGSKFIVTLPVKQVADGREVEVSGDTLQGKVKAELLLDIYKLQEQLKGSREIITAIREGKIDALVSYEPAGEKIYTLKSADEGYRVLIESMSEGALILDPNGSIYYANKRFDEMLGKKRNHIVTYSFIDYIDSKDRCRFKALLRRLRSGKDARGEIYLIAESGARIPVYLSLNPLQIEDFEGVCATITDLTDYKQHAAELAAANEALRAEAIERKQAQEELKTAMEKLERSNRDLQDFASVASHDLQEPLRKIQSFSERLKAKYADSLSPEGIDYLQRMQNAAERMRSFIQDLLRYSRVATRVEPFKEVDLRSLLAQVMNDLQLRVEQTGGTVEIGELPSLEADAMQMRQLFQNLIGNALKFHREEKPEVRVYGEIVNGDEISTSKPSKGGSFCRIFVEDNGIGFSEDYVERIFAPFQRLHGRSAYEGSGMGLAICKRIVERHGGTITARSTPGEGSTFIVLLPQKQLQGEDS